MSTSPTPAAPTDASHDFDFLTGTWNIANRRLPKPLQGSNEWEAFSAVNTARLLPGGIGNTDEFKPDAGWRPGFVGATLRVYNPQTGLWSIFWLTNRDGGVDASTGNLQSPVIGRFEGDTGFFYGDELFNGQPIKVRFEWTRVSPNVARWQQAFSADGGKTWELNWVMDMTRQPVH
jgi:hypothetical protein